MSIPYNFVAPNLLIPPTEYDKSEEQRLRNVLRLYFNLLDNTNFVTNEQVSTNQTLNWLNTWS
jgi:hypothetical protein